LEWRYLIRLEQPGKPPQPHTAILDRGLPNPSDDLHYIRPEEATFQDNDVAFFFNAFEQALQVTIIQKVEPGFHETVRMTQPSSRNRSPNMKIQTIDSHRLFTKEMLSHYEDTEEVESVLKSTPQKVISHRLTDELEPIPPQVNNKLMLQGQRGPPSAPDTMDPDSTEGKERPTKSHRRGEKRKTPPLDGGTVVLQKKRRVRGKGRIPPKLMIQWATNTIPCAFSDLLTPATVITDVGTHMGVLNNVILKMTLSSNNPTLLQRDIPFSKQGITAGDTLRLLVRHVTITGPDGIQHLVAYRADETIRDLLITLQGVSPISPLSEIILCHNELHLDHHKQFQECNLPEGSALHASLNTIGNIPSAHMSLVTINPSTGKECNPPIKGIDETLERRNDGNDPFAGVEISEPECSQIFLQDPMGKTHSLNFQNSKSLGINLLIHSPYLKLPSLEEIYLISGSRILNLTESLSENGLPHEALLRVILRCRGGMRGAPKGPTRGPPWSKGLGTKSAERGGRQMGGSDGDEVSFHRTPPSRGGRGRGVGGSRRPTLVHLGTQETMDEDDRSASLIAIQEAHRIMLMHHCRQSWEDSERAIGFGLPLKGATEMPLLKTELNKVGGIGPGTPFLATKTARLLDMEPLDRKSPTEEDKEPKPLSKEVTTVEPLISHNQTPGRDRKTGGAKGKQNIRTIATDTRPGTTRQIGKGRREPIKAMDSQSTDSPLDTDTHKDAFLPTQLLTHPQSSDSPPPNAEDTLTGSTPRSRTEKPISPNESSSRPQTVTGVQLVQTVTPVNERDSERLTGPTPQRQMDSDQGLQPDTTAKEGLIPTMPSRKAKNGKAQPKTKEEVRNETTVTTERARPDAQTHMLMAKKEEEPAPILTPIQLQSLAKRRRQQSRAKPPKNSTACFHLSTLVLKRTLWGAT